MFTAMSLGESVWMGCHPVVVIRGTDQFAVLVEAVNTHPEARIIAVYDVQGAGELRGDDAVAPPPRHVAVGKRDLGVGVVR
jgi:hypothetical protein